MRLLQAILVAAFIAAPVGARAETATANPSIAALDDYFEGKRYEVGSDVAPDPAKAREFYMKAAEAGHTGAMNDLSIMLREGRGGPRDLAASIQYLLRSAEGGLAVAMHRVAIAHEVGSGVPRDLRAAMEWHRKLVAAGNPEAQADVDRLARILNDSRPPANSTVPAGRWATFDFGGQYAAGIEKEGSQLVFVCNIDSIIMYYRPGSVRYLEEHGPVTMNLMFNAHVMTGPTAAVYWIPNPDGVDVLMRDAAHANSIVMGLSAVDAPGGPLHDAVEFTGRGSTAALKELRSVCK